MCLRAQDLSGAFGWPTGINVYLSFDTTYPLDKKILLTELFVDHKNRLSVYFLIHAVCLHETKPIHHAGGLFGRYFLFLVLTYAEQKYPSLWCVRSCCYLVSELGQRWARAGQIRQHDGTVRDDGEEALLKQWELVTVPASMAKVECARKPEPSTHL